MTSKIILPSIIILLLAFFALSTSNSSNAQTTPPLDDGEYISTSELYDNSGLVQRTQIGRSTIDSSIWTVITDSVGVEIANRLAIGIEIDIYINEERFFKIENWVDNRTIELASCEDDASTALALGNWTTLSSGQQNAIITSLLTCQEINSKVNRKTINALLAKFEELDINGS